MSSWERRGKRSLRNRRAK
ncbi:hypothetical protein A2U01_0082563, partial [Trifolium medium]|nr:hypothetical protein [Trifolium medium]